MCQITGKGLDIGIVDDPIKGRAEANSKAVRDKIPEIVGSPGVVVTGPDCLTEIVGLERLLKCHNQFSVQGDSNTWPIPIFRESRSRS
jgi:hypothetical protein